MRPVKFIFIALLAWPVLEFVAFICVAIAMGLKSAFFLILLMSFAGLLVLRHSGDVRRFRAAAGAGVTDAMFSRPGMAPGLGGILLLIPGFVSSALGVAVLFPASRRWLLAGFRRMFATSQRPPDRHTIDLAPHEWHSLPGSKLPPASGSPGE